MCFMSSSLKFWYPHRTLGSFTPQKTIIQNLYYKMQLSYFSFSWATVKSCYRHAILWEVVYCNSRNLQLRLLSVLMIKIKTNTLLAYLLHTAEYFLRSKPVFSYVKKFPAFYWIQSSLPHLQVPATCPYPEPARSSPHSHIPLPEDRS